MARVVIVHDSIAIVEKALVHLDPVVASGSSGRRPIVRALDPQTVRSSHGSLTSMSCREAIDPVVRLLEQPN